MTRFVTDFPGREIIHNREKFLYFGGTAYLGLQTDSVYQDLLIKNIKKYGTNYGASRKSNIRFSIYKKAEKHLAHLVGGNNCLTLSSGYLAGQLVSNFFHKNGHPCFYAPQTHVALHQLHSKNHEDVAQLALDLKKASVNNNKSAVLFLESIHLNGLNYPDFNWLKKLPLSNTIIVIDDSHGLGLVGENGGGVFKSLKKLKSKELILCSSLSKAFGLQGGLIVASHQIIKKLKSLPLFAAASPVSPASLATLIDSTPLVAKKRLLLKNNISNFIENLKNTAAITYLENYPCFQFKDEKLPAHLLTKNILITNFKYPTENDLEVQRIVLSANHTSQDIEKLVQVLNEYYGK